MPQAPRQAPIPPGELWSLILRPGQIDEQALWEALKDQLLAGPADSRTRMLVHEALVALRERWGQARLRRRLNTLAVASDLQHLCDEPLEEPRFPSLRTRLVQATSPENILQFLRELAARLRQPTSMTVGGSSALLLADLIVRRTEDIVVVDELPEAIRAEPALVDELAGRYGLRLTHFASHYLPDGWERRARPLGHFAGRLDVRVLDALDVLCGKLFSRRHKDLDDLRAAWPVVDRQALRQRLTDSTARLRSDEGLAEAARHNWYILTGDDQLP